MNKLLRGNTIYEFETFFYSGLLHNFKYMSLG